MSDIHANENASNGIAAQAQAALEAARNRLAAAKAGDDPDELRAANQELAELRAIARGIATAEGRPASLSVNVN